MRIRILTGIFIPVMALAVVISCSEGFFGDLEKLREEAIEENSGGAKTYTVIFNTDGASGTPLPETAEAGSWIVLPDGSGFSKNGYRFDGWRINGQDYKPGATYWPTGNVTATARWTRIIEYVSEVADYLAAQANGLSPDDPVELTLKIALGYMNAGSGWQNLLDAIESVKKYVNLDLSGSSIGGTGISFTADPGYPNGKAYITGMVLPNTATTIPAGTSANPTFMHFSNLKYISAAGLTTINEYSFTDCRTLASVDFPNATEYIKTYAFKGCENLREVNLPKVTMIAMFAFASCTSLEWLFVPMLEFTDYWSFENTGETHLTITLGEQIPFFLEPFDGVHNKRITIRVPQSAFNTYNNNPGWKADLQKGTTGIFLELVAYSVE